VQHISKTIACRTFVKPLVQAMTRDTRYRAASMGQLLGEGWSAKKVASKLCVLGRPEKRFHAMIFQRPADGEFLITAEMKAALMAAV